MILGDILYQSFPIDVLTNLSHSLLFLVQGLFLLDPHLLKQMLGNDVDCVQISDLSLAYRDDSIDVAKIGAIFCHEIVD